MRSLPDHGEPIDRIERRLDGFLDLDPHRRHVALSLGIHYVSDEIQDVLRRAHNRFAHHDNYFVYMRPGSHAIERDVLAIAEELLGAGTPVSPPTSARAAPRPRSTRCSPLGSGPAPRNRTSADPRSSLRSARTTC